MNSSKNVFLLTKTGSDLSEYRKYFSLTHLPVTGCCSLGSLLCSCVEKPGCVVFSAKDYTDDEILKDEILKVVEGLRNAELPHAMVVVDPKPSFQRARELLRLPICEYFQWPISSQELERILQNAMEWSETLGVRAVRHLVIKNHWNTLDADLKTVLRLLYAGKSNKEIAAEMSVTVRMIETRRAKLFKIFEVKTLVGLVLATTAIFDG